MKILINEKQYQHIYNNPDRPFLTEVAFVENENPEDDENIDVGDGDEPMALSTGLLYDGIEK